MRLYYICTVTRKSKIIWVNFTFKKHLPRSWKPSYVHWMDNAQFDSEHNSYLQLNLVQKIVDKALLTPVQRQASPFLKTCVYDDDRLPPLLPAKDKQLIQSLLENLRYLTDRTKLDIAIAVLHLAWLRNSLCKITSMFPNMFCITGTKPKLIYIVAEHITITAHDLLRQWFCNVKRRKIGKRYKSYFSRINRLWSSCRQLMVAFSTCKVKYSGTSFTLQRTLWLTNLFRKLIPQWKD